MILLFSVLESSRRVVQKSSSEAKAHGLIFTLKLECNACLCKWMVRPWASRFRFLTPGSSQRQVAQLLMQLWRLYVDEEIGRAEAPNPPPAAPEAAAAPRPEETQGMRLEREALELGQPRSDGGLSSGSNVEDMRNRLKALGAPVWGTKAQMWPRLVHAEARRELQKREEAVPESSQKQEDKVNSVCQQFQTNRHLLREHATKSHTYRINRGVHGAWEKGRAKPQLQRPVESVKVPEFEMDFCYLLQSAW